MHRLPNRTTLHLRTKPSPPYSPSPTASAYPNPPHSSRSPTIIPVNVNATVPPLQKTITTSSKKPDTPHANDNTSSRTAHTPQRAAPMPSRPLTSKILVNENTRNPSLPHTQKPPAPNPSPTTPTSPLILPNHHLKGLRIHQTPLSATIRRQPLDKLRRPRMRIRPHHAPVHRKRLHLRIHTLLADLHITIRIERHHRTVDLPLRTRRHLHIPQLPHPASTAQTKSPANNTHLQTSKPIIKVNATADRPPPRFLSMKMCINVQQTKKFARILYNPTDYPKIRATNSSLPYSPRGALRLRMLTATQTRSKSGTLSDRLPDALHNIPNILIRHIRTCRQAEPDLEQVLLHTICINRSSRIHRLLVHRLPYRTALDLLGKHEHAQSLHILIRLTIRRIYFQIFKTFGYKKLKNSEFYTCWAGRFRSIGLFSQWLYYRNTILIIVLSSSCQAINMYCIKTINNGDFS